MVRLIACLMIVCVCEASSLRLVRESWDALEEVNTWWVVCVMDVE